MSATADLALVLRSGSLPASLTTLEERTGGVCGPALASSRKTTGPSGPGPVIVTVTLNLGQSGDMAELRDHALNGQRMHHGVAILSRVPLKEPGKHDWQDNGEARHVGARLDCGIRLENVYIPAGGDIPDRKLNPKFGQKLDFIERMTRWSEKLREPTLVVGDFNVAPAAGTYVPVMSRRTVSAAVCAPRNISTAKSAADCDGIDNTRRTLCA